MVRSAWIFEELWSRVKGLRALLGTGLGAVEALGELEGSGGSRLLEVAT